MPPEILVETVKIGSVCRLSHLTECAGAGFKGAPTRLGSSKRIFMVLHAKRALFLSGCLQHFILLMKNLFRMDEDYGKDNTIWCTGHPTAQWCVGR